MTRAMKQHCSRRSIRKAASLLCLHGEPDNAFIILEAKHLNPAIRAITVLKDPENRPKLQDIGADVIIAPDDLSARIIALSSETHFSLGFFDQELKAKSLTLSEISVPRSGPIVGKPLSDLDIPRRFGVSVVAISRDNVLRPNPDPSERLEPGAQIVVFGERNRAQKFRNWVSGGRPVGEIVPQVSGPSSLANEVRTRGPRLVTNAFLIGVAIVLKSLISPVFSAAGLTINLQNIFSLAIDLVVWATIGYLLLSILRDFKVLADAGALRASGLDALVETEGAKRILRNVIFIIVIVILGSVVSPYLGSLGGIARAVGTVMPWICLGLLLVVMYDVGSFIHDVMSGYVRRITNRFVRQLEEAA